MLEKGSPCCCEQACLSHTEQTVLQLQSKIPPSAAASSPHKRCSLYSYLHSPRPVHESLSRRCVGAFIGAREARPGQRVG